MEHVVYGEALLQPRLQVLPEIFLQIACAAFGPGRTQKFDSNQETATLSAAGRRHIICKDDEGIARLASVSRRRSCSWRWQSKVNGLRPTCHRTSGTVKVESNSIRDMSWFLGGTGSKSGSVHESMPDSNSWIGVCDSLNLED